MLDRSFNFNAPVFHYKTCAYQVVETCDFESLTSGIKLRELNVQYRNYLIRDLLCETVKYRQYSTDPIQETLHDEGVAFRVQLLPVALTVDFHGTIREISILQ